MSPGAPETQKQKLLPGDASAPTAPVEITPTVGPARQLHELPKDELEHLAEEYGINPSECKSRQHLVAAVHERRQAIAAMERDALMDVVRWGRRPVTESATKEQLAQEIVRIRSMRFAGLSQRGLLVLAKLRGVKVSPTEEVPALVKKLKKQEGFFARMGRKRRAWLGSMVSNMLGESAAAGEYQYIPPTDDAGPTAGGKTPSIRDEIEESGLFGGITSRIKRSADEYLNQKLDEIEARIDRKLDEIDRRLAEWRDKEIANRIRILKITLWASVIVGAFSLIYSYVKEAVNPSVPPTQVHSVPVAPNK